jgi:hypothetical protein
VEALAGEVDQVQRLQREKGPIERIEAVGEDETHQERGKRHGHERAEDERDDALVH